MDFNKHTTPGSLERYSFLWSEVRLLVAALALFIGGYPPVFYLVRAAPGLYGITSTLVTIAWIISGAASAYLLYRWLTNNKMLFGGKDTKDMVWFLISVVSGINLGLAGLGFGNIGMSLVPYGLMRIIFLVTGVVYVVAAYNLHRRWKSHGEKLF